jgi:hypothetical protein
MAYRVNSFNQDTVLQVQDATINKETHISLVGKNWYGYGEVMAENLYHMTEHFAGSSNPLASKSIRGQIYYNTAEEKFYYFNRTPDDGGEWKDLRLGSVVPLTVKDTGNNDHYVTLFVDGNDIISLASNDTFDIKNDQDGLPYDVYTTFFNVSSSTSTIGRGINLNPTADYKFHGTATSAQYADLAEYYSSDAEYEPGTVLKIGGEAEVTQTTTAFCPEVFGIVSTDPAYLMNSNLGGTRVAVALEGRVPVKVIGQVKKGQRLLSSEEPGVARAPTDYEMQEYMDWYRIVGRALEDKTTEGIGLVEVAVGVK